MGAYRFAEYAQDADGNYPPEPKELVDLAIIERFGVKAAYGRDVLSYGEIQRMTIVENIYNAYLSRKGSKDWAKWAADNPRANATIIDVEVNLDADD